MRATADVQDLLVAAFSACRELPAPEETAAVHRGLVAEIKRRLPAAERAAAAAPDRSRDWYAHDRVIRAARDALQLEGEEPSPHEGALVAGMRVAALGRCVRALVAYPSEGEVS
ncbi:DUF6415 family natural product biosynthesis protein [Streptomyces lasiicapitis]|uniref:DUF6415 family natural product biosynthesis protein n=1 Tax=Streptomyces lasiicapitis TaxID=1923961 RepID=UPI003652D120